MSQLEIARGRLLRRRQGRSGLRGLSVLPDRCEGAFHGRTLGSLHLTRSKAAHQLGYGKFAWSRHIRFNGDAGELAAQIDPRPLTDILRPPGGVRGVPRHGRMPRD
jgi:hypothetical protein